MSTFIAYTVRQFKQNMSGIPLYRLQINYANWED